MSAHPDPKRFYTEALPAQFERALQDQERAVEDARRGSDAPQLEAAERVLAGMRAAQATLCVQVRGEGGGTYYLNIDGGRLLAGDAPAQPPLLTLVQDRPSFERLAGEAGESAMGFLGGLSGLAGEMKLTRGRIQQLAGVAGCVRFEVGGAEGFSLLTHFGPGSVPEEPQTRITVSPEAYQALREGALEPQDAFLSGQIQVEGDMQLAMQVALAALAPD